LFQKGVMMRQIQWMGAVLLAGVALGQSKPPELNVLCSVTQAWCDVLAKNYNAAKINLVRLSSAEALSRLRLEKNKPSFDVWFGGTGDPHVEALQDSLTRLYRVKNFEDLRPELRRAVSLSYTPLYQGILGIGINPGVLKTKNLPVPKCWRDLANPVYKGMIQMSNPNTSGTAYTLMTTLVTILGEDKAFDLMAKIHPNVSEYTRSGVAPRVALANGTAAIGVQFMHDLIEYKKQGFFVQVIAPCEGTGFEIGGLSLVRFAPNLEQGRKFMDWAVTPDAQVLAYQAGSYSLPSNSKTPIDNDVPNPKDFKLISPDRKWGLFNTRERLIERWNKEVFALPR
jgi:iron(III) transport system substrate-binding protein